MSDSSYSQIQQQQQALTQTLSPQQLLAVQLLEMTTVEIEDRVRGEVMDNPALDAIEPDETMQQGGDEDDVPDVYSVDTDDDYSGNDDIPVATGGFVPSMENAYGDVVSFGDTLMEQLGALSLSPEEDIHWTKHSQHHKLFLLTVINFVQQILMAIANAQEIKPFPLPFQ